MASLLAAVNRVNDNLSFGLERLTPENQVPTTKLKPAMTFRLAGALPGCTLGRDLIEQPALAAADCLAMVDTFAVAFINRLGDADHRLAGE